MYLSSFKLTEAGCSPLHWLLAFSPGQSRHPPKQSAHVSMRFPREARWYPQVPEQFVVVFNEVSQAALHSSHHDSVRGREADGFVDQNTDFSAGTIICGDSGQHSVSVAFMVSGTFRRPSVAVWRVYFQRDCFGIDQGHSENGWVFKYVRQYRWASSPNQLLACAGSHRVAAARRPRAMPMDECWGRHDHFDFVLEHSNRGHPILAGTTCARRIRSGWLALLMGNTCKKTKGDQ